MNKFLIRFICCFIPKREIRDKLRNSIKCYKIVGKDNKIYVDGKLYKGIIPGLKIEIVGNNNRLYLPKKAKFQNSLIYINKSDNCSIEISDTNCGLQNLFIIACCGNNQKLSIGRNFHCFGGIMNLNEQGATIQIGNDVLFSNSISLWPTDGHAIINADTGEVLNNITKPIKIGNHCWVGEGVKFTKNAQIPDNTIVGIGSVVTRNFLETNTILAGNPAKVIKTNVAWDHMNPYWKDRELRGL